MKLYYWIAVSNANECYSLIGKTKKEVITQMQELSSINFEPPVRKVLEYRDAFDLFDWATGEGGGRNSGSKV